MTQPVPEWNDDNHPLHTGRLLMMLTQAGFLVEPVMVGRDYTPWIDITLPKIEGVTNGLEKRIVRIHVESVREDSDA